MLREGGVWGVPACGLMFMKRDGKLVLTARMPWMPEMAGTVTPAELKEQQDVLYADSCGTSTPPASASSTPRSRSEMTWIEKFREMTEAKTQDERIERADAGDPRARSRRGEKRGHPRSSSPPTKGDTVTVIDVLVAARKIADDAGIEWRDLDALLPQQQLAQIRSRIAQESAPRLTGVNAPARRRLVAVMPAYNEEATILYRGGAEPPTGTLRPDPNERRTTMARARGLAPWSPRPTHSYCSIRSTRCSLSTVTFR
jgi:hypothetical protein